MFEIRTSKKSEKTCCSATRVKASEPLHPDHSDILPRLRKAQGQLAGIEKMVQERRYCVDILIQFKAAVAALKAAEASIFEKHLRSCVQDAMNSNNPKTTEAKIDELVSLFQRT